MSHTEVCTIRKVIYRSAGSLALLLILQIGMFLWWGGKMSARMQHVEGAVEGVSSRVYALEVGSHD